MAVKVGINGFGRIGRNIYRTAIGDPDIDFVAVNDLTDTKTLAHLLKYDSVLGNLDHEVTTTENGIKVENDEFRVFSQRDPAAIDWESVGAEIVIVDTIGHALQPFDDVKICHNRRNRRLNLFLTWRRRYRRYLSSARNQAASGSSRYS